MTLEGKFIVFEGIDKSGKDTQAMLLAERLRKRGYKVFLTHEPIESNLWGKIIRFVLKHHTPLPPIFFQRMYYWNRLPHVKEIIQHQNAGEVVICVRYWFTTVAHSFLSIGEKAKKIIQWHQYMPKPDIVFYLDLSAEEAIRRLEASGRKADFFEKKQKLETILKGYGFCWTNIPYLKQFDCICLDAHLSKERIYEIITRRRIFFEYID